MDDGVATDRYFPNTFADYRGEDHLDSHRQVILRWIEVQTRRINGDDHPEDPSVYTGSTGKVVPSTHG